MWVEHLLEAMRATVDVPRTLVSYQQLLGDWRAHMRRLADQLKLTWDPDIEQAGSEIEAYLVPDERHHDVSRQSPDAQAGQAPPPYLKNLYAACVETSLDMDWLRLATFDNQFRALSGVFAGPLDEVIIQRDAARQYGSEQQHLALERLECIDQLSATLATTASERGALEALGVERLGRIHQLEVDLARAELDLAVRTNELHQVRGQLEHVLTLAGSRWWALKRVLRPLRPPQSRGDIGKD
jgi:hypothetical protein